MSIFAIINNATNICDNTVVYNGSNWPAPADHYSVNIDGLSVGIGYYYDPQTKVWTAPPTVSASFNPTPVFIGQNTALSWASENASTVTISELPGQSFPASGSQSIVFSSTGSKTVTVTATGLAGSNSTSVIIKVYAAGEVLPQ